MVGFSRRLSSACWWSS